jgi:flagellar assembly protein FliH
MTSSRRGVLRAAVLAPEEMFVPLRAAPGPFTLAGAGGPDALAANAEAEARAIIAEAELLRDRAVEEGYAHGLAAGHEDARAQMADGLAAVEALVRALASELESLPDALAAETGAIAMEVAARVVRAELTVHPERVLDVVRAAIRRATDRERLLVHVNPADLALVREEGEGMVTRIGGIGRLDVVDDPRIPRGGCIVETSGGDVDARLQSQMARMMESLAAGADEDLLDAHDPGA